MSGCGAISPNPRETVALSLPPSIVTVHSALCFLLRLLSLSLSLTHTVTQRHKNQKRKQERMDFPNWVQALPFILLNLVNRYFHFLIQAWPFFLFLLLDRLFYHFFKTEVSLSLSLSFFLDKPLSHF